MRLTKDEKKNLWDAAKLTAYIAERNRAAEGMIFRDMERDRRQTRERIENVRGWNPHKWKR